MTKIGIIEDNNALRKSVRLLLESSGAYEVVLSEASCNGILEKLTTAQPQLMLMDIDMPGMNGIEGVRLIRQHYPAINIVMFTVFEDDEKIFQSLMAGAVGYILKKMPARKILDALQEVKDGGAPMSPAIARQVIQMVTGNRKAAHQQFNLSQREVEILQGLVKGHSYKTLAQELHISSETVRSHLKNIYSKLHVHSKTEAVAVALKEKLI